ncbi:autotransporter domain-containing protein, partial [Alphaproteobacteria bacterium]|nr:autotransporter domain-containing protein [Alphaproteobacteria bacterium]
TFTTTGPDETADTALDWDAGTNGAGTNVAAHDLRVQDDGTITFSADATVGDVSTTIAGITAGVTGKTLTIDDNSTDDGANTATIAGGIDVNGLAALNVAITGNNQDATADLFTVDVNGNVNLGTGTLTVTADNANDNNDLTLALGGNYTGGTISLNRGGANSEVNLHFDGTTAQTISGAIQGVNDNEGDILIANEAGVTFNGAIGGGAASVDTILIALDAKNVSATFTSDVDATNGITLGDGAGMEVNGVTFGGAADTTVTGAIAGGAAAQTNSVMITGAKRVTFGSDMGANIDTVTVGAGATLDAGTLTTTSISLGAGSTLNTTTDGKTFTGAIDGAGTLDIDHNTTVVGSVGGTTALTAIDVFTGKTLTVDGDAAGADVTVSAGGIALNGAGSTVVFDADDTMAMTVKGAITATTADQGVLTVGVDNAVETFTFENNIGTSDNKLASIASSDVAGVHTINAKGNVFANAITLGANDVLNLVGSSAQTVSGTIDGTGSVEGTINVGDGTTASNVTFQGKIGNTQDPILFKLFTGSTATLMADTSVTGANATTNFDVDGTLNVDASANTVLIDATDGFFDSDGTINVTGAENVNFDGADGVRIDGSLMTVLSGTTKTLELEAAAGSVLIGTVADTTVTAGNQIVTTGNTTFGGTGLTNTLAIMKTADFTPGATDATAVVNATGDTVTVATDGVLNVTIASGSLEFDNGDQFTVIGSNGNATTAYNTLLGNGDIVLVDTALIDIQDDSSDAQDLKVKVVTKSAADVLGNSTGVGAATSLLALSSTATSGTLQTIRSNLQSAATADAAKEIAESIAPTVDGGALVAGISVGNQSAAQVNARLASLRDGNASTGMAAGNMSNGLRAWGQAFGQTGEQDQRDGVAGYDVDTYGFALGMDTEGLGDNLTVGLAVSYGDTEVDSKNANNTKTDIDTYQFTLYGNYDVDDRTYVAGQVAYAMGDNDTTRSNVGGTGTSANGDFDSNQYSARLEAGRSYNVSGGTKLTPNVMANYVHYDADSYTETGAGTANLRVDSDAVNLFEIGVGVDASWPKQLSDGGYVAPGINLGVRHDVIGDEFESTSNFTGGGAAFNTKGFDPAQTTFDVGAGVVYSTPSNWELTASYDYEAKSDFDSHTGLLKAGYKF